MPPQTHSRNQYILEPCLSLRKQEHRQEGDQEADVLRRAVLGRVHVLRVRGVAFRPCVIFCLIDQSGSVVAGVEGNGQERAMR